MVLQKSPGGSAYPYYFKGGTLLGLHYGSFFKDEAALLLRMRAEEQFIIDSVRQSPLWIDFYQTRLTGNILLQFSNSILRLQKHITKMAIVGCTFWDKRRLMNSLKRSGREFPMPVRFFSDPEQAKTWLVSETFKD
jgi:hypothetical protein